MLVPGGAKPDPGDGTTISEVKRGRTCRCRSAPGRGLLRFRTSLDVLRLFTIAGAEAMDACLVVEIRLIRPGRRRRQVEMIILEMVLLRVTVLDDGRSAVHTPGDFVAGR